MIEHGEATDNANKEKEMRIIEISRMISEGGLGADRYYSIENFYTEPGKK